MKKRVLALLLSIALVFSLCIAVSATGEAADTFSVIGDESIGIIGGEDGDTSILYGEDEIYYGDDSFYTIGSESDIYSSGYSPEDIEYMFSQFGEENVGILIAAVVVIMICSLLFLPALIVLIVFAVLNSKLKKKIKECEARVLAMQQPQQPYAPQQAVPYTVAPQAEPQPVPYNTVPQEEPQPTEAPAEAPVDNNEGGEE